MESSKVLCTKLVSSYDDHGIQQNRHMERILDSNAKGSIPSAGCALMSCIIKSPSSARVGLRGVKKGWEQRRKTPLCLEDHGGISKTSQDQINRILSAPRNAK